MQTTADGFPRAFAVMFSSMKRWDVSSFHDMTWHWPAEMLVPIGELLTPRKEKVDRKAFAFENLQPVTIHFDGSMDKRIVDARRAYTMDLFFARPGDIVVAKIDLKNGAVGIVPEAWENVVVTGHFAVYETDHSRLLPEYLFRVIQSSAFKAHLWRNKVGAEGRKEVKLDFFEAQRIPLPPLHVQRAIVDQWQTAQDEIAAEVERLTFNERVVAHKIYTTLRTPIAKDAAIMPKAFALRWKDMERWSVGYIQHALKGVLGFTHSQYPIVPLSECLTGTMNGKSILPVSRETPYRVLKLNAISDSGLNLSLTKPVEVEEAVAKRFTLRKNDLLICRSIGSFDQIAKCALVNEDIPNVLFPDIIIRAQFNDKVLPEYVREVMQTPLGRTYFQANTRTAVGMWKIGGEDIKNFPIPLPPLSVQQEIVERVGEMRDQIRTARAALLQKQAAVKQRTEEIIAGTRPVLV